MLSIVAVATLLVVGSAQAAVITPTYVAGGISSTSNFAPGTTTAVSLTGGTPTVNLGAGQFFRFGMAVSVTGNSNPAAGGTWDQANVATNGAAFALPANLGMAVLNAKVLSSDPTGATLAVFANGTNTRATVGTGQSWASKTVGDAAGGNAGTVISIFEGQGPFDASDSSQYPRLGYFAPGPTNFFTTLTYSASASATGQVTLTPQLIASALNIWTNTFAGATDTGDNTGDPNFAPATFVARPFAVGTDSLGALPDITVSFVPEPASMGLIGMSLLGLLARRRVA